MDHAPVGKEVPEHLAGILASQITVEDFFIITPYFRLLTWFNF
ncbi:hypothetical protein CLOSYM_03075 [[Clostridium] symbiosum ATCC 14940]|uniref:Uncharacterized protein n=1 Tax=[Clostridium] symbiosum ATCC 14940 TaxID=411472 RepID=A0ABC9TVU3_CLOSY|nr:hypothetical protein CLOSYM_03075 [[Clostridium] symbiosum ATCC 14940]